MLSNFHPAPHFWIAITATIIIINFVLIIPLGVRIYKAEDLEIEIAGFKLNENNFKAYINKQNKNTEALQKEVAKLIDDTKQLEKEKSNLFSLTTKLKKEIIILEDKKILVSKNGKQSSLSTLIKIIDKLDETQKGTVSPATLRAYHSNISYISDHQPKGYVYIKP